MTSIRILLAEDHNLVRAGICALLQKLEGVEVVGEAGDGKEALSLVEQEQPDIILLDIGMPKLNGLEVAKIITKSNHTKVIILSMHTTEEYVLQALSAGATGYLLKDAGTAELEIAIKSVMNREIYLSPTVSKHVVMDYAGRVVGKERVNKHITPRQRDILQLIAEGLNTRQIAEKLNISIKTVETHRAQLMAQLNIQSVIGLVRYAIRTGLVTLDE